MHDIRFIRENPQAFDAGLALRGLAPLADSILAADAQSRSIQNSLQELLAERNEASKAIGQAKAKKDEALAAQLMERVGTLKETIPALEAQHREAAEAVSALLAGLPNLPAEGVPEGKDEDENVEVKRWGDPKPAEGAKEHFDIGAPLGLDFESAQSVSGARFAYLRGGVARLSRALGQFMLDTHTTKFGYEEVAPPVLVRDEALFGTAQLPKFAEDLFQTTDGRWLIPTAEVSLTNLARDQIVETATLPLRFTALTSCFRSEAGAAGKDTRGLIRQHQFDKVELVSITTPEESDAEHERMTEAAEHILETLVLPYRRMLLCTGDMGFSARRTYDLEVWLPGQGKYREISSCSNCGDFQARRMDARYKPEGQKSTRFLHTLNGSGLAVGRTLVAVLENYQNTDGSVTVPEALRPYMGGLDVLRP
ncbi:serine--tRNA ligase [Novosphingobium terrae]|uniref:serine--tRNA ligase n=1 Tax=Novosphingobium terrae TaxID=2726189 RepID=UPI001982092F|nr:serine--tRNA ligase [Novosphingobium terrae]